MKAKEFIIKLEKLVQEHGDIEMYKESIQRFLDDRDTEISVICYAPAETAEFYPNGEEAIQYPERFIIAG